MPNKESDVYALVVTIKAVCSKPRDEQTDEEREAAAVAFESLIAKGERLIRFWTRKMQSLGKEEGDAYSWVIEWLHRIVMTYDSRNPYFWSNASQCLQRKMINFLDQERRRRKREVFVDTTKEPFCLSVECACDASAETVVLSKEISRAVQEELGEDETELLMWVVDGGTFKDFATMKGLSPREVANQMADIRQRIKTRVGG